MTRECLAAVPDTSIPGRRVARELTALIGRRGKPGMIVSDNGTEFTCNAILTWSEDNQIAWHFIALSRQANRCRTASVKASTAGCETSFSTKPYSSALITPEPGLRRGPMTTIATARIRQLGYLTPAACSANLTARATGCATPTSSADRTLLTPRQTA